jgi:hypothetical protein
MPVLRHRLAIAGVIAAAAIAVPVAALASGPGSPPAKPGPPAAAAPSASKSPAPPDAAAVASKEAAASQPDGAAPGASKTPPPGKQAVLPAPVAAFIARLGVGADKGAPAFKEVDGLVTNGGTADPANPAFAAIAREAGVSPERLAAAWDSVSQEAAGL